MKIDDKDHKMKELESILFDIHFELTVTHACIHSIHSYI